MATQTMAEAAKLINNELVRGIALDIVTTNPIWNVIPTIGFKGQAVMVNREQALGDAQFLSVGGTITAKNPSQTARTAFEATTIIGDAELNGLVAATSGSAGVDQMAVEVSSKAKSIGRKMQNGMATGDGALPNYNSLHSLVDSGQYTAASTGQNLTYESILELLDLVKAKDGEVDWIMGNGTQLRKFKAMVIALGGVNEHAVFEMPNGQKRNVTMFEGIPFFQNDWLPTTETANGAALTGGNFSSLWAGCWDDGSKKVGAAIIHPEGTPAGIDVKAIGAKESKDEEIVRVKSYSNFAIFNRRGLARLPSLNN